MASTMTVDPILNAAQRLGKQLQSLEEVKRFRQAEEQIQNSECVKKYIALIKQKQKELVHAKHYQKTKHIHQLEKELTQLNQEFDELPIVQEYQQMQVGVNDLLQTIQDVIAATVSKKLQVETGGEVSSGCGSGGPCGCSG